MGSFEDYYRALRIQSNANDEDIRKAHHAGVLKFHPDKQTTDEEVRKNTPVFRSIQEAYEVLKEQKTRKTYDLAYATNENGTDTRRTPPPTPKKPAEPERSEFRRPDFPRRTRWPENESSRPKKWSQLRSPQDFQAALEFLMGAQHHFVAQKDATEVAGIEARTYFELHFNKIHQDVQQSPAGKVYSPVSRRDALNLWSGLAGKLHALELEMIKLTWKLDKIGIFWDKFLKAMKRKDTNEFVTANQQIKEGRELLADLDREIGLYRKSAW
ncbi:J domain-containing protein [Venturia nashicola]|nr:J domain-containing protein [Venturia nashicola]